MSKLKLLDQSFEWMPFVNPDQFRRLLDSRKISITDRMQFEFSESHVNMHSGFDTLLETGDIVINTRQGWTRIPGRLVHFLFDLTEYRQTDGTH